MLKLVSEMTSGYASLDIRLRRYLGQSSRDSHAIRHHASYTRLWYLGARSLPASEAPLNQDISWESSLYSSCHFTTELCGKTWKATFGKLHRVVFKPVHLIDGVLLMSSPAEGALLPKLHASRNILGSRSTDDSTYSALERNMASHVERPVS